MRTAEIRDDELSRGFDRMEQGNCPRLECSGKLTCVRVDETLHRASDTPQWILERAAKLGRVPSGNDFTSYYYHYRCVTCRHECSSTKLFDGVLLN